MTPEELYRSGLNDMTTDDLREVINAQDIVIRSLQAQLAAQDAARGEIVGECIGCGLETVLKPGTRVATNCPSCRAKFKGAALPPSSQPAQEQP